MPTRVYFEKTENILSVPTGNPFLLDILLYYKELRMSAGLFYGRKIQNQPEAPVYKNTKM
jgi:hypothetical protein